MINSQSTLKKINRMTCNNTKMRNTFSLRNKDKII